MLGSVQDAEDAVQEALLAAWRGLPGFEGRATLRAWLYRISTNVCLRLIDRRPRRVLSPEYGPPRADTADLGEPVTEPIWLEPIVTDIEDAQDPETTYVQRESIELAFVAAMQTPAGHSARRADPSGRPAVLRRRGRRTPGHHTGVGQQRPAARPQVAR
jgi:RNA polymerase sigma-70 factor (ECF subfamily)